MSEVEREREESSIALRKKTKNRISYCYRKKKQENIKQIHHNVGSVFDKSRSAHSLKSPSACN